MIQEIRRRSKGITLRPRRPTIWGADVMGELFNPVIQRKVEKDGWCSFDETMACMNSIGRSVIIRPADAVRAFSALNGHIKNPEEAPSAWPVFLLLTAENCYLHTGLVSCQSAIDSGVADFYIPAGWMTRMLDTFEDPEMDLVTNVGWQKDSDIKDNWSLVAIEASGTHIPLDTKLSPCFQAGVYYAS
jgi:hypothetical protein